MKAYSDDLRLRIHEALQAGDAPSEVAERFGVSPAFARRLRQRFRETGSIAARKPRNRRTSALDAHEDEILKRAADLSPRQIRDDLGLKCSPFTVWHAIRRFGDTFKKSHAFARLGA